jgi:hypothetical protein
MLCHQPPLSPQILGYGTNEHAYRVFNKTTGCVEVTEDVTFDESNGSQV